MLSSLSGSERISEVTSVFWTGCDAKIVVERPNNRERHLAQKRKTHAEEFKARVAVEAIKGVRTLSELSPDSAVD